MKYVNLLNKIKDFSYIAVTGPQRSGTRISSCILSSDLGYHWVAESQYDWFNMDKFKNLIETNDNCVIHSASLCMKIIEMPTKVAVVFLFRNTEDIIASVNRLECSNKKKKQYIDYISKKYDLYQNLIKRDDLRGRLFPLEYESLSVHDLWVSKEQRANWGSFQWKH